ncbi:hypothetical protein T190607A01A_70077 [Tenacibaculum sp. 190524A05c]|uniref:Uncharacterized protein n=1 Tax=Tenacibaculum platacis TaxID=3137852 RepID=A0ABM9P6B6_9FLAO
MEELLSVLFPELSIILVELLEKDNGVFNPIKNFPFSVCAKDDEIVITTNSNCRVLIFIL